MFHHLQALPYSLQEDVVDHMPNRTLLSLSLVSHYYHDLVARSFYAAVILRTTCVTLTGKFGIINGRTVSNTIRRQNAFLLALNRRPQIAMFVRIVHWEMFPDLTPSAPPHRAVRKAFAKLTAIRSLQFNAIGASFPKAYSRLTGPGDTFQFSNLRSLTVEGDFACQMLDSVITGHSSRIAELIVRGDPHCALSPVGGERVARFLLQASGAHSRLLSNLKSLDIELDLPQSSLLQDALTTFLAWACSNLTALSIRVRDFDQPSGDVATMCHSPLHVFTSGCYWPCLESLCIGGLKVSLEMEREIRLNCPRLPSVSSTPLMRLEQTVVIPF